MNIAYTTETGERVLVFKRDATKKVQCSKCPNMVDVVAHRTAPTVCFSCKEKRRKEYNIAIGRANALKRWNATDEKYTNLTNHYEK